MDVHHHKQLKNMNVEELKQLVRDIEEHYEKWERGELEEEPPIVTAYRYALAMKKLREAGAVSKKTWQYVKS